jgi:hypothetical protein
VVEVVSVVDVVEVPGGIVLEVVSVVDVVEAVVEVVSVEDVAVDEVAVDEVVVVVSGAQQHVPPALEHSCTWNSKSPSSHSPLLQ